MKYRACDDFVDSEIKRTPRKGFTGVQLRCHTLYVCMMKGVQMCDGKHKCAKQSKFRINSKRNITSLALILSVVHMSWTAITTTKSVNGSEMLHAFPLTRHFHQKPSFFTLHCSPINISLFLKWYQNVCQNLSKRFLHQNCSFLPFIFIFGRFLRFFWPVLNDF